MFLWGFLTFPSGIPLLPVCCLTQGVSVEIKEVFKVEGHVSLPGRTQRSVSILLCLCAVALGLSSLLSGCQRKLALPGLKRTPLSKRGIYILGLA